MDAEAGAKDPRGVQPGRAYREVCGRCRRPRVVCYCAHVPVLPTRTRILLLQHPREEHTAIGTARMAHLSLPNSMLRVGLDFATDTLVAAALAEASGTYVLFPKGAAIDLADLPAERPTTLIVLDGTWWQARKLLKLNPALAALPRIKVTPRGPSEYRIRREPAEDYVSTIEALAQVLSAIEPPGVAFAPLMDPFRAMVDHQVRFAKETHAHRHRVGAPARRKQPRPSLAERLAADAAHLVCVQGEANAWPRRDPGWRDPETIHWVAHRPATGQTYEAIVAPRVPLAPATPRHARLSAECLGAGISRQDWLDSWRAWLRPEDRLVQWGTYYGDLAARDQLALPARRMDLRAEVSQMFRQRVGTIDDCAARLGATPAALGLDGRGGHRLAVMTGVVKVICAGP